MNEHAEESQILVGEHVGDFDKHRTVSLVFLNDHFPAALCY